MLGSVYDADDALQDALLRAWRALGALRGPQLAALVALHDRHQHLPDPDPAAARSGCCRSTTGRPPTRTPGPGEPLVETVWIEPYPGRELGVEDGLAGPDARYEQRESVELAFIAALQHLPATQRAVLILREVLGFSAKEVAETLDTTRRVGQQRAAAGARVGRGARCPSAASRQTLRALGDDEVRAMVGPLRRRLGAQRRRGGRRRCSPRTRRSRCRRWRAGSGRDGDRAVPARARRCPARGAGRAS